jgi:DNA-nicking Smr family endonuclease
MPRRRSLTPEERALWQAVADGIRPLHPPAPAGSGAEPAELPAGPAGAAREPPARPAPFRIGEAAAPPPRPAAKAPPPRIDARTFARLRRGRLAPEARLDLHGLTLAEAHGELLRFVLAAQTRGLRLLLVITGKGRSAGGAGAAHRPPGLLRQQVPHWLRLPPLGGLVLETAEAHPRHGGAGALYVYLRRGGQST